MSDLFPSEAWHHSSRPLPVCLVGLQASNVAWGTVPYENVIARYQFSNPTPALNRTSAAADLHNKWKWPYRHERATSISQCQTRKRKASSENTSWLIKVQKEKLHAHTATGATSWGPFSLQPYWLLCGSSARQKNPIVFLLNISCYMLLYLRDEASAPYSTGFPRTRTEWMPFHFSWV